MPKFRRVWVPIKWKRGWKAIPQPSLQDRALTEARQLVGVMEMGGNNNGPKVMEIIRANGGTGPEPWCGDFVAYCYKRAGSKVVSRSWAAVRFLGTLTGQRVVAKPKPGDLVCFAFDHVGLFVRWDGVGKLVTIEGNTGASGAVSDGNGSDGVYVKRREVSQVARFVRVLR
jgi:uncharacterized protein (TIGR02594 family)